MKVARIRGTETYVEVVNQGASRVLVSYVTNTGLKMEKIAHWVDIHDLIFDPVPPTQSVADAEAPQVFSMVGGSERLNGAEKEQTEFVKLVISRMQELIDEIESTY